MAARYMVGGLTCLLSVSASSLVPRQGFTDTAFVDLSTTRGPPKHLAAGFIYGIPDDPNQIPDSFYADMGFNYARFGGAQMTEGGWVNGYTAYQARFNNSRDNYHVARRFNATSILLPHDIWGTDHATASTQWPGDNGNWTDYDLFLDTLIGDLKANNMLQGMVFDIWNEADGYFWARSATQFYATYVRTHKRIRSDPALNGMLISGPSSASQPSVNNGWWTGWLNAVLANDAIPDQYSWHDEPGDVATDSYNFNYLLQQYKAPRRPVNINEYAVFSEQNSASAVWWISRLERYQYIGLRGNWLSGCQLRDFMASLLTRPNLDSCVGSNYTGNGEYQVYKYYYQNMTGQLATTSGTNDGVMDVYATIGTDKVRILTGVNNRIGTWYITINNLSALGLPNNGTLNIHTYGFKDNDHFGAVGAPVDLGVYGHGYQGDTVSFPVFQTSQDAHTAWTFEFDVPAKSPVITACAKQATTYGPVTSQPDTDAAFLANPIYNATASAAKTPAGYTLAFQNLTGSVQGNGYLGSRALKSYDVASCAKACASATNCKSFNVFYNRVPTLNPADGCPNPASQTAITCTLWQAAKQAADATNYGQYRKSFHVVTAGSNGYNLS